MVIEGIIRGETNAALVGGWMVSSSVQLGVHQVDGIPFRLQLGKVLGKRLCVRVMAFCGPFLDLIFSTTKF